MILPEQSQIVKSAAHDPLTCGLGPSYCSGCAEEHRRRKDHDARIAAAKAAKRMAWMRRRAEVLYWQGLSEVETEARLVRIDERNSPPNDYDQGREWAAHQAVQSVFQGRSRPSARALARHRRRKFEARVRKMLARELPEAARLIHGLNGSGRHAEK